MISPSNRSPPEDAAREVAESLSGPRGAAAATLLQLLHARTAPEYFARVSREELVAQAQSLFELIEKPIDGVRVRVRAEGRARKGPPARLALESAMRDQPFILDSLLELIRVHKHETIEVLHPIVSVERGPHGGVVRVGPPRQGAELLSLIHIELPAQIPEVERTKLAREAEEVLEEARVVADDFEPILERVREVEQRLVSREKVATNETLRAELREAAEFLDWLRRANFVFLGYRAYDIHGDGPQAVMQVRARSGLGILRDEASSSFAKPRLVSSLPDDVRQRIAAPGVILVHKANSDSKVVRRARMDLVGVKTFDGRGRMVSEDRFLGLFTSRAYNDLPSDIPILRKKLDLIIEKAGIVPGSHDHKEVFSIFTSIPKSELFATSAEKIAELVMSVISSSGRREVKVTYRTDFLERGVSAMVLIPREKFNTEVRAAIQNLLAQEFKGTPVDYRLALSDEPMARLHFYFETRQDASQRPSFDVLETKVRQLIRSWEDRLREALIAEHGPEEGDRLAMRHARSFPPQYVAVKSPETAVSDIAHIEQVLREGKMDVAAAQQKLPGGKRTSVLKIYAPGEPFALSALMPVLTNLGLNVLDEQTFRVAPGDGKSEVHIHSFRVHLPDGQPLPAGRVARAIEEIVTSVIAGETDDDPLNSLAPSAGLERREIEVLRGYCAYLLQLGGPFSRRTVYAALRENAAAAETLLRLFEARFDPTLSDKARKTSTDEVRAAFQSALASVKGIVEDHALRALENLILASVRTSWFRRGADGEPLRALAVKIRSADVLSMPDPRPLYEIFVHAADVEGVHLRSGKVARGGIRWSSRPDDYRMEILGLMKAQRTKNAIIVPVGAKGGFLLKRAPAQPSPEDIQRQYEVFIGALLDVTDNVVAGTVVHPPDVVVHDEEDPYFVVAADRGTASFSDVANKIAVARGFWLGDAFASGGSRGFNHKVEGITARGVWECAERHFREAGIDPRRQPFTMAGIGDMSGDVFGNGLIALQTIRLVAAFNHAHVFIDPDPDPAQSFAERKRLFILPKSQWTDYDPKKISKGGGVWRRDAKVIQLSSEARRALGVSAEALNGDEVVRAILKMQVDILYNGGIGTYVKAASETNQEVGDPVNNPVRVNGSELRAKIVAEGGNLGFTQLGRIEYARAGGRINTDFIDNSAGVDLSDHEVNLKILLARAQGRGALKDEERDAVLFAAKDRVCEQVLRDNYLQGRALTLEERRGVQALDEHRYLIDELTAAGLLNRAVERIPGDVELLRLRESRLGLTRPQLAVLLAYAKIEAYVRVLGSGFGMDTDMQPFLMEYFPPQVTERFPDDVRTHPLRAEIASTAAVNAAINAMGSTYFHSTARAAGALFEEVLRAFLAAAALARAGDFEHSMDGLYAAGATRMEALHGGHARFQDALGRIVKGILRRGLGARPARETILKYGTSTARYTASLVSKRAGDRATETLELPPAILDSIHAAESLGEAMDLADVGEAAKASPEAAMAAWDEAGSALLMARVESQAARVVRLTAEEVQSCESLLEAAHAHRRSLARAILSGKKAPPASHPELVRAARILEGAGGREPLTPSGLFVVVEALGRAVEK